MNPTPTIQDLLERDKDKIAELSRNRASERPDPMWELLAEFGLYFGWQATLDAMNDEISFRDFNDLLKAARRIDAAKRHNFVLDTYMANAASQTKDGAKVLRKYLGELIK